MIWFSHPLIYFHHRTLLIIYLFLLWLFGEYGSEVYVNFAGLEACAIEETLNMLVNNEQCLIFRHFLVWLLIYFVFRFLM